ncbi:lyase family protein, partial [Idiomarina sp. UBA4206]
MSQDYRTEKDSMGEIKVPQNALYAAQTQRAVDNFSISGLTLPAKMIQAIAMVKASAARANAKIGQLDQKHADAIEKAAQEIIDGKHLEHFPVDVFQTGSGTSSNMNANEVIANLAKQQGLDIHPNDHVNQSQSSNDVIPTAIQIASVLAVEKQLEPALKQLVDTIRSKAIELRDVVKTGRTHLMDAMPMTMAQELEAWAGQLEVTTEQLPQLLQRSRILPQGGTAIGTGINAPKEFAAEFADALTQVSGSQF